MKNLKGLVAVSAAMVALTGVAMASEASYEYYAHPTLFSSESQVTIEDGIKSDRAYTVGEKGKLCDEQVVLKGKEKVAVDAFVTNVMDLLKLNSTEKKFNPKSPILRSELAVVLAEGLRLPEVGPSQKFIDITDNWAQKWIYRVDAEGVMIGYKENGKNEKFKPDQLVTKAEVFATLATLMEVPTDGTSTLPAYKGYKMQHIPNWAIAPTKEVMASKLLNDMPEPEKVASEKYLSREQVAYLVGVWQKYYASSYKTFMSNGYTPSYVSAKLDERVDAKHANIGDTFTATTTKDVTISGTTFAAGSKVIGEVVEINRPGIKNPGYIKVQFKKIKNGSTCVELPKNITAQPSVDAAHQPVKGAVSRFFAAPLSAAGRVCGVAGRTAGAALNVAGNGTERLGDNWSNTLYDGFSLKPVPAVKNFGRGFVTVGKGVFDLAKLAVSGTTGVVYEVLDEVVYLILPSKSADSSLNPNDEIMIVY